MVSVGDDGGDARQQNPGALRGAVLTANGLGGRGTWTTKQGVDYSTFRLALLESKGGRVRPSVEPAVTDTTAVSSNATSRTSSTNDLSRSTADTREPSTSGRANVFQHAAVGDKNAVIESPIQINKSSSSITVAKWSHGSHKHGIQMVILGRVGGGVDILRIRPMEPKGSTGNTGKQSRVTGKQPGEGQKFQLSCEAQLDGHCSAITSTDWSTTDDRIVTASQDGDVCVWSCRAGDTGGDSSTGDTSGDTVGDDTKTKWTCSRVIGCGDDTIAVRDVKFHPLNPNVLFVALAARSLMVVNVSTGQCSCRVSSPTWMPSKLTTLCVDKVGAFVFCGDTDGQLIAVKYNRADLNQSKRRNGLVISEKLVNGDRAGVQGVSEEVPQRSDDDSAATISNADSEPPSEQSTSVPSTDIQASPGVKKTLRQKLTQARQALQNKQIAIKQIGGEHGLHFVSKAPPPSDLPRDGFGVASLTFSPYARCANGPAVFAVFASSAVRVYAVSGTSTQSTRGMGRSDVLRNKKPTLECVLRCAPFPMWPGVKKGFVRICPVIDPMSPIQCVASHQGGNATVYALPSNNGAPAMKSVVLAATAGEHETEKPVASACDFDQTGSKALLGYEKGGVLLWSRESK